MTKADYREMASEIRDLIPLLLHPRCVADLRLLADRYERLADYLEVSTLPDARPVRPFSAAKRLLSGGASTHAE
jgi:hypothetical protein